MITLCKRKKDERWITINGFLLFIIAVMSWMAMLFYLPRLFVYHVEHVEKRACRSGKNPRVQNLQVHRSSSFLGNPASGLSMIIADPQLLSSGGWIYAKFTVLIALTLYSFSLEKYRLQLADGTCTKDGKFFRAYNEVPTALAILIVGYVSSPKAFHGAFTLITLGIFAMIIDVILDGKKKLAFTRVSVEALFFHTATLRVKENTPQHHNPSYRV